jgi:hypothetical protein
MELLKELCESTGIPGQESRLRQIARRELEPLADDLTVDALGNLQDAIQEAARKLRLSQTIVRLTQLVRVLVCVAHVYKLCRVNWAANVLISCFGMKTQRNLLSMQWHLLKRNCFLKLLAR